MVGRMQSAAAVASKREVSISRWQLTASLSIRLKNLAIGVNICLTHPSQQSCDIVLRLTEYSSMVLERSKFYSICSTMVQQSYVMSTILKFYNSDSTESTISRVHSVLPSNMMATFHENPTLDSANSIITITFVNKLQGVSPILSFGNSTNIL